MDASSNCLSTVSCAVATCSEEQAEPVELEWKLAQNMLNVWVYFIAELSNETNSPPYEIHKEETGRNSWEIATLLVQHLFIYIFISQEISENVNVFRN